MAKKITNKKISGPGEVTDEMREQLRLKRLKNQAQMNQRLATSRTQLANQRAASSQHALNRSVKAFQGASRLTNPQASRIASQRMFNAFRNAQAAAKSPLAGRTAEFGTRSLLEGMKSWMRGGGGFRIGGK